MNAEQHAIRKRNPTIKYGFVQNNEWCIYSLIKINNNSILLWSVIATERQTVTIWVQWEDVKLFIALVAQLIYFDHTGLQIEEKKHVFGLFFKLFVLHVLSAYCFVIWNSARIYNQTKQSWIQKPWVWVHAYDE